MARGRQIRRRGAAAPQEDHDDSSDDNDNAANDDHDEQDQHQEEEEHVNDNESMQDGMQEDEGNSPTNSNRRNNNHPPANHDDDANEEEEDGTLKILLSTDNHLGYLERDPIRGRDSFAALEEVLSLARHHKVDMVLLSGDLFHDNKPSRKTLHSTMEILRRYCMGAESVGFQIVSDQKECLRSLISGRANYEDEFYSVDLPIFTIHGNHDDPTRDGGPDLLSAVDLLSISNLVNYFGRQDDVEKVKVSPVLIQKGDTKVALYGMGSMRDERLNRMWQGKKVKFLRPEQGIDNEEYNDNEEAKEWFNIFTLHQNRDLGRGSKNCVHESMIPEWMDLVVWGHEHECLINPSESLVGTFRITQPGSSVATSLTAGEARRKHCGLLEIKGHQFRLQPLTLSSVRSFAVGEVNLGERAREQGGVLDVEDPKVEERMSEVLAAEVEALIQKARDESEILQQDADAEAARSRALEDEFDDSDKRERKYSIKNPEKVLVRLKVEHTGFTTLNNQRFGSQFVGQVANPSDILLFHKRRQAENAKGGKGGAGKKKRGTALDVPLEPEDLENINIEDLVTENLVNNDKKLELLDEKSMGEALEQFVDKMETKAISLRTEQILEDNQKILMKRARGGGEDGDATAMDNPTSVREFLSNITGKKRAEYEMELEEAEEEKEKEKATKKDKGGASKSAGAKKRANSKDDDSMIDSEEDERPTKKKSRVATTASKKATAKSRKTYDDSDSDDFEDPPPKKRATAKKATAKKATASKARSRHAPAADSDSEIEYMGNTQSQATSKPVARSARAGRSTAKKTKYTYKDSDVEEIDDDSDVEETPRPSARGGRKKPAVRSAGTSRARPSSQTQSTMTSFTSARKPATAARGGGSRVQYSESDDEPTSGFGGGGAWGSASQSTKGRGRR